MHKINICNRVDLYIHDEGFRFWSGLKSPKIRDLWQWKNWGESWRVYLKDDIKTKIYKYLDSLPERYKSKIFYQKIVF